MAAGRGVLRAELAVVLHRDAAIRAAAGGAGGRRFCAGHSGNVHLSCGICRGDCVARESFAGHERASPLRFSGWRMEFALMHMPAIGFPWDLLGLRGGGKFGVRATDGDHGNFRAFAGGRILQRAGGVDRSANVTAQARRNGMVGSGANAVLIVIAVAGPRFVPQAPADHVGAFGADEFSRVQRLSVGLDANARGGNGSARSRSASARRKKTPGIVVWPEVPAPFSLQDANFQARAERIARGAGSGFLVGVIDWKPLAQRPNRREQQRGAARTRRRAGFHL